MSPSKFLFEGGIEGREDMRAFLTFLSILGIFTPKLGGSNCLTFVCFSDDILHAVECLKPLGSGFSIVTVGSKQMIRSIPKELSTDQSTVLEAIQMLGFITTSMIEDNLGWEPERAETVLEDLLADSLVWVDLQAKEKEYWAPPTDTGED